MTSNAQNSVSIFNFQNGQTAVRATIDANGFFLDFFPMGTFQSNAVNGVADCVDRVLVRAERNSANTYRGLFFGSAAEGLHRVQYYAAAVVFTGTIQSNGVYDSGGVKILGSQIGVDLDPNGSGRTLSALEGNFNTIVQALMDHGLIVGI